MVRSLSCNRRNCLMFDALFDRFRLGQPRPLVISEHDRSLRFILGAHSADVRQTEFPQSDRHAVLVTDPGRLFEAKRRLFGTKKRDVFSSSEVLADDLYVRELHYARVQRHTRNLLARMPQQAFLGVPFVADLYRGIVPHPEHFISTVAATASLFERGYDHVSIVLTNYNSYYACLVQEAISCGVPYDIVVDRTFGARMGSLEDFVSGNRRSSPADWRLRRRKSVYERHPTALQSDCILVLCSLSPTLRACIDAIKAISSDWSRCQIFTVDEMHAGILARKGITASSLLPESELLVRNPAQLVDAVKQFLLTFHDELTNRNRVADTPSWRAFGKNILTTYDQTLLRIEKTVTQLLRYGTFVDHLDDAIEACRPRQIFKFPSEPSRYDGALHYLAKKHAVTVRSLSAERQIVRLSNVAESGLIDDSQFGKEFEVDEATHGKSLRLVLGIKKADIVSIRKAIAQAKVAVPSGTSKRRPVVLLQEYHGLGDVDFGCDKFTELDLIPTNSTIEESIYREVDEHEHELLSRLPQHFLGVPLTSDIYRGIVPSPERTLHLSKSVRLLLEKGYDDIWIVLGPYSHYHSALILEAYRCGMVPADFKIRIAWNGTLKTFSKLTENNRWSLPSDWLHRFTAFEAKRQIGRSRAWNAKNSRWSPSSWLRRFSISEAEPQIGRSRILIVAASVAPAYLKNAVEVLHALQALERDVTIYTIYDSQVEALEKHGFFARSLDVGHEYYARNPNELVDSVDKFWRAWCADANTRVWTGQAGDWTCYGQNTLHAYDRVIVNFEETMSSLLRHCTLIDRLDGLLTEMKPSAIYKFPSGGTVCDGILYYLAQKHGIPLISSIYLSITASHRNLDRTPHDVLTTLGEEQSDILRTAIPVRKIVEVGQPEMDAIHREWPKDVSYKYVKRKLPSLANKKLVVVATSAFDIDGEMKWIPALVRVCAERGDCFVVVKLHPSTMPQRYQKLLRDNPGLPAKIVADDTIAPYLRMASLVVTDLSHAGKMAVYLGCALLAVNTTGKEFPYNRFNEEGVAPLARNNQELKWHVNRMLDGNISMDARASFIKKHFHSDDGKASERIAEVILAECKQREAKTQASK